MATQNLGNASIFTLGYDGKLDPPEGAKVAGPYACDWSAATGYRISLGSLQSQGGQMSMVNGLYVDNSRVGTAIVIVFDGTNFRLPVKANSAGFFPVFATNPVGFTVSGGDATNTSLIYVHNFRESPLVWDAL